MILIYTGNGKGKTSACIGQAIRTTGQGKQVVFGQFFKTPDQAGEQLVLSNLLKTNFRANGPGFYFENQSNFAEHREAGLNLLAWAKQKAADCFILILDEAIYALSAGIISNEELKELILFCTDKNIHLVLSGRNAPEWLIEIADLVSEIQEVKHPMQSGQKAQAGIEF